NRIRDITNLIYPLGTSYLIFHNDTWSKNVNNYKQGNLELLRKISQLDNIKNEKNIGIYKIFNVLDNGTNKPVHQVNIPSQSIMVLGGLDAYPSLSTLSSFDSLKSSVVFMDSDPKSSNFAYPHNTSLVIDGPQSYENLALSFVNDKYMIAPISGTNRDDPAIAW